ncbi:MAG: hypothetical protein ACI9D5_001894 [Candidatus Endobugula sp.]|jgi:hypothetical protein
MATERDKEKAYKPLLLYPNKSALSYSIPAVEVNVLQFFQLSACELQRLIGQRNSSLGKLMKDYHALLYEYEFLILAQHCQQTLDKNGALYAALTKAIAHKKNHLHNVRWNTTFASDEMRHLFSLGSQPLTVQQLSEHPIELITALEYLDTWLSKPTIENQTLHDSYKVLATRKYIGELRLTMAMTVSALAQATSIIDKRLAKKPLCRQPQSNPEFKVVNRVFHLFYIGEVQPFIAKLHQQGQTLLNLIDQLQASLTPNQIFIHFWDAVYTAENSEWQSFNHAISTHTIAWQKLLRQCGHLPN